MYFILQPKIHMLIYPHVIVKRMLEAFKRVFSANNRLYTLLVSEHAWKRI
jgi:hypothetical protein